MLNSFSERRVVKVAVGLVAGIACIVQTQTMAQALVDGIYTIQSLGTIPGPTYLDGRTFNGTVGLASTYTGGFTGARWEIRNRGSYYTIRSCGDQPGADYLDGRTGDGTVGLAPTYIGGFTGARWTISRPFALAVFGGTVSFHAIQSQGTTAGPNYLDGKTGDGTVGLAPGFAERFTGARWSLVPIGGACSGAG